MLLQVEKWLLISILGKPSYNCSCYIAGNFFPITHALIGYFMVRWHLIVKLFPPKSLSGQHSKKSMMSGVNSALLPANVDRRPPLQRGLMNSSFRVSSYITNHLVKVWFLGKQLMLFPSNLNVSLSFASGKMPDIVGKKINVSPRDQSLSVYLLFPWQEEVVRDTERWHWSSDHDICQSKEGKSCVPPQRTVETTCKKKEPTESERGSARARAELPCTDSLLVFV